MMVWLALGGMTLLVLACLLWPLLSQFRVPAEPLQHDLEVYRDQLREIKSDLSRGSINEADAAAAEQEVNRRILAAAERPRKMSPVNDRWRAATAGVVAILIPVAAAILYADLGKPWEPAQPLALRADIPAQSSPQTAANSGAPSADQQPTDIGDMAGRLEQRLEKNPEDREGWKLLGRTYWELRRFDDAIAAYLKAKSLSDEPDPGLELALGEAYVFAADGMVTPAAKNAFTTVIEIEAQHPGARYYLGLADFQSNRPQQAYDRWLALASDTPEGAPWIPILRSRLEEVGQQLEIDVAAALPPAFSATGDAQPSRNNQSAAANPPPGPTQEDVQAAQQMNPEERMAFIRSMVERLADRLKGEPDDVEGWQRLAQAYTVLKEDEKALLAYGELARLQPNDVPTLEQYASALMENKSEDTGNLPADAIDIYQRILTQNPNHGMALYFTGADALRRGDAENAIQAWEKLLTVMPPTAPQYNQLKQELERIKAERG